MTVRPHWIEPSDEYPITVAHCQCLDGDCPDRAEVFCLCGCERQISRQCAEREFQERQQRMAANILRHRRDPINARAIASHSTPEAVRSGLLDDYPALRWLKRGASIPTEAR